MHLPSTMAAVAPGDALAEALADALAEALTVGLVAAAVDLGVLKTPAIAAPPRATPTTRIAAMALTAHFRSRRTRSERRCIRRS